MPSPEFVLYVRLGCHVCETAAAELAHAGVAFVRVDIDRDDALREEYGTLVPVLHDRGRDREWYYPFSGNFFKEWHDEKTRPDSD